MHSRNLRGHLSWLGKRACRERRTPQQPSVLRAGGEADWRWDGKVASLPPGLGGDPELPRAHRDSAMRRL